MTVAETWKTKMSMEMQTRNRPGRLRKFQLGTRVPLATGLDSMCVTLWQKVLLYFAHVLRLCVTMNLKTVG